MATYVELRILLNVHFSFPCTFVVTLLFRTFHKNSFSDSQFYLLLLLSFKRSAFGRIKARKKKKTKQSVSFLPSHETSLFFSSFSLSALLCSLCCTPKFCVCCHQPFFSTKQTQTSKHTPRVLLILLSTLAFSLACVSVYFSILLSVELLST